MESLSSAGTILSSKVWLTDGGIWSVFQDETKTKDDLTVTKLLLRVASPFDVPKSIRLFANGRPFLIKIKTGLFKSRSDVYSDQNDGISSEDIWEESSSENGEHDDRTQLVNLGAQSSLEEVQNRVNTWLEEGQTGGNVELNPEGFCFQWTKLMLLTWRVTIRVKGATFISGKWRWFLFRRKWTTEVECMRLRTTKL
ncbi:uncharacterized protein LOC120127834 isoform X1 [Hibiscus syriacus]|uniref:uncharacterized protein LOC120127834 isoform X1 n=1 Tax=Hibiscus syriacus TaxID=106335 RepID=UPI0019222BA7|nr:uncharacterized protein LOC120127834 isoform X1 [Hibiscus syriacus]